MKQKNKKKMHHQKYQCLEPRQAHPRKRNLRRNPKVKSLPVHLQTKREDQSQEKVSVLKEIRMEKIKFKNMLRKSSRK